MADEVLLFVTYKPKEKALAELRELFSSRTTKPLDLDAAAEMLRKHLDLKFKPALRGMPSYDFVLALDGVDETRALTMDDTFVFALDTIDPHSREAAELFDLVRKPRKDLLVHDVHVAVDLPTGLANVWCPKEGSFPLFGDLDLALAQMRAGPAAAARGADGRNVNVVIIDQGINRNVLGQRVPGANFVGGWSTPEFDKGGPPGPFNLIPPGGWRDDGLGPMVTHGTKMASLVLAVAPQARILDLALLPSHILNLRNVGLVRGFLSWAAAAYLMLVTLIPWIKKNIPGFGGPWVLNNSWAVYDLSTDFPPGDPRNYGSNPNHQLNFAVAELPRLGIADVVFAAGNCGQFCPDARCGARQIGPGRTIYGVAAISDVLTVAAVRGDETWLGYSSQGPADPNFGSFKPDLCAPSQFASVEPGPPRIADWDRSFTGTSSACALTAGAVAARRSLVPAQAPPALRAHAVATARQVVKQVGPDERRGAGMIDVANFV
jgi:subtilisin family serine protease